MRDDMWIVDNDITDQHLRIGGLTEDQMRAGFALAQAMGWLQPGTEVAFRQLSQDA